MMPKRKAVERSGTKRPRHEKPEVVAESINPFELRVNKRKHHVLGQRGARGERGMPGVSRAKAIEKRKRTLLKEYRERHKTNQLVDKRFGEYDENLTAEEKMMKRFMMEKQRKHRRKAMFNLEEEEGEGLTHYGQSLGDMAHFNDLQLSSGEEDGEVDDTLTHFGGFLRKKQYDSTGKEEETNEDKPRTRKEVMEEVVAKAKLHKHERQVEKDRAEELMQQLDTDWKEIRSLLSCTPKQPAPSYGTDNYDTYLTELASQPRAKATDRIKSEDELGEEKRALLQKQKLELLQRMRSTASLKSDTSAPHLSADYMPNRGPKYFQQNPDVEPVVESLQDTTLGEKEEDGGCEEDSEEKNGEEDKEDGEEEEDSEEDEEDGEEEEDSEEDEEDSEEEEGNPAEEMGSDLESSDESEAENEEEDKEDRHTQSKKKKSQQVKSIVKCSDVIVPQSTEELSAMTEDKSPDECGDLIERMHSSVTNKQSLERLFVVAVDFCLGDESMVKEQEDRGWFTDKKLMMLNSLARPLFQLGHVNPSVTADTFQQLLKSVSQRLFRSKGKSFLLPADLIMFKLVVLLFPMSDYRHPLTTPAMHLMTLYLSKCRPAGVRSIVSGLFVCHCLYESISLSQRFVPELMNYLTSLVGCFVKGKAILYAPFTSKTSDILQPLGSTGSEDGRMSMLQLLTTTHLHTLNTKLSVLGQTLKLLHQLAELWKDLFMFDVVFKPAIENAQSIPCHTLPQHIKKMTATLCDTIQTYSAAPKPVLQLLTSKPASLKLFEPKYNLVYRADRRSSQSRTAGERQRLKHKVKREWKGAIREIRKDSKFLARVKLKDQLARDADRSRRVKQIDSWLQEERHETKMERRGGGRRGGSKGKGRRQKA